MPLLAERGQPFARVVSSAGFRVYHAIEQFLWAFMIVATALVVVRTLIVIWLAYRFRKRPSAEFAEPVSVVIAAYNEGKVIADTLRALLTSEYEGEIEVVVVDDGSRDQTAAEIERVADVAETRAELEGRGIEFSGETYDTGVCHMAPFDDPDGNRFMLHRRYAPND